MSGRGAYYKNKYGGGGRGRGGRGDFDYGNREFFDSGGRHERRSEDLYENFCRLEGKPYGAYRDLEGEWRVDDFQIFIDKTQSDPFAPPSHIRARLPMAVAQFPAEWCKKKIRNIAVCDFVTRKIYEEIHKEGIYYAECRGEGWASSKGNEIRIDKPSQNVLQRSSVVVNKNFVECRCTLSLPAHGRTIEGRKAAELVCKKFINTLRRCLVFSNLNFDALKKHVLSIEDQQFLRDHLKERGLVGFVRNGAVLPRMSGVDDRPMDIHQSSTEVIKFTSPKSLEVEFDLPNSGKLLGMGIREGITLIVGGGFNGKTTLLEALQFGVYNKIPGDGREFVAVLDNAVKIRAEDGRPVTSVDISPFISTLPYGRETTNFMSLDSSGSTSQSANILEMMEINTQLLIIDEDTCATNFMIRDLRMQQLVAKDKEPINAFVHKVRPLYEEHKISTILIVGGCGDFFDVADTVIHMDAYVPFDVTEKAKNIAKQFNEKYGCSQDESTNKSFGKVRQRVLAPESLLLNGKVRSQSVRSISYGEREIDMSYVEQLVEPSQTRAIADLLALIDRKHILNNQKTMKEVMMQVKSVLEGNPENDEPGDNGLDKIDSWDHPTGFYSLPRIYEIAAAINRLRGLKISKIKN